MDAKKVNPADQIRQEIQTAKNDLNELIQDANLGDLRDAYTDLDTGLANLGVRIQKIRDRKYAFNKISEQQAQEFQKQWSTKKFAIQSQINLESSNLKAALRTLETRVAGLSAGLPNATLVKNAQTDLDNFESRISASERAIREMFDDLKIEVDKLTQQLDKVEFTLDNADAASFGFLPGESVVMGVKATWTRDGKDDKDDPQGVLFLTDQRLVFEQKQEVATKKVLFVTTERELVQKLQFEVPVVSVENVKATKQGLFKNEDWLELTLATGSFARDTRMHLDGQDSMEWQKLINRVKSREIEADRAFAVDQAAVEKARSAPSQCPNCNGAITKPVLRGQDSITCEFCGTVIRL